MSLGQTQRPGPNDTLTERTADTADLDLLEVLDDDHSRDILEAISAEPKPARALVEECDASRSTVYRRLDRLAEAGLVESGMELDADGHHRTIFEATLEELTFDIRDGEISLRVTTGSTNLFDSGQRELASLG